MISNISLPSLNSVTIRCCFTASADIILEKTDDMENAEWWLRKAADRGLELASYLVYKGYRDGKFTERPGDKLRYLRMAVDAGFGYAEYEYAKYLMDRSPDDAKEYLTQSRLSRLASKRNTPTVRCSLTRVSVRKRRNGLNVPHGQMRGHRRESGSYSTTSTRITRQAKPSFSLQPSRATSLPVRCYVQLSRGSTPVLSSAYATCFTMQVTSLTREARICTAKSIRSITTVLTRSNAVRIRQSGKELLCINRKEL